MIPLTDAFFEDEIREGFYVPAEVKQAWGAEITVLNEIDRVCKKHGLKYFACWGTLLGAIRHGGVIPWDDDFDITMIREDYEKFMAVWKDELPEGYDVINFKTHSYQDQFISNVVGKSRACFEKEHLEMFHGFAYISGIDIFLLDNMSRSDEEESQRMKIMDLILKIADAIYAGDMKGEEAAKSIRQIEKWCGVTVPKNLKGIELRIYLYTVAEKWMSAISKDNSDRITQVVPWGILNNRYKFNRKDFEETIDLPFEGGTIPASRIYAEHISKCYGDYMKIYKDVGGHNYPYFDKQKEDLQAVLDFELPGYKVTKEDLEALRGTPKEYSRTSGNENSYRNLAGQMADYLEVLCANLINENIEEQLANMQQAAIDLGTFIEAVKGEGYCTVSKLEELCELLFNYSSSLDEETYNRIKQTITDVKNDIASRREVVFMPYKPAYWQAMQHEYEKAMSDQQNDVYVVPIPYYYKKYDGILRDMQYDFDAYPKELSAIRCDEFNLEVHCPDVIVIQNPYDEYNTVTSVPTYFYSTNLRKICDELVYIPWFTTSEFDKTDARAYKNMRYYVQMPGVVNADKVLVQSDNIRSLYIDKLCELTDEDTRGMWEAKIVAFDVQGMRESNIVKSSAKTKTLLYMNDCSCVILHKDVVASKLRSVMETFAQSGVEGKIRVLYIEQPDFKENLIGFDKSLYEEYMKIVDEYLVCDWCESVKLSDATESLAEDSYLSKVQEIVSMGDAYYGDGGVVAHYCRNAGKPVMIQNYDIP